MLPVKVDGCFLEHAVLQSHGPVDKPQLVGEAQSPGGECWAKQGQRPCGDTGHGVACLPAELTSCEIGEQIKIIKHRSA